MRKQPAWVDEVSKQLAMNIYGQDYISAIISAHAPDAEAVAVALEQQIYQCRGTSEYGHGMNLTIVHTLCCSSARATLAAYRAAHPLSTGGIPAHTTPIPESGH